MGGKGESTEGEVGGREGASDKGKCLLTDGADTADIDRQKQG